MSIFALMNSAVELGIRYASNRQIVGQLQALAEVRRQQVEKAAISISRPIDLSKARYGFLGRTRIYSHQAKLCFEPRWELLKIRSG